ncbi:hypothetical protein C2845_PM01G02920 [Panicum miliaceum]|uniref:Uncharacterized protein n=1 Tax=Panicum miliaceum TaxID=4540 RepID=A0A3L6TNI7_PANMI|nr:hypothetical protein C2845_PM01G02920 [Panicum miliaceum]
MDRHVSLDTRSVRVQIPDLLPTLFEPQKAVTMAPRIRASVVVDDDVDVPLPERRLTMLALQLAVLEKAASRLGTLGFIWATVVLLGGFAITLGQTDFWCITTLLLVEGARILGRSHELEWQHEATGREPVMSLAAGRVFYWLQLLSASACVALSLVRLAHQHYGGSPEARTNRRSALDIFYGLMLAEALLFLVEKALWQWRLGHHRLLERVAEECHLATACGEAAVRRFFYDSYSRCLDGSIFDGLHMDLVSYADDLLIAGTHDEQCLGASVLVALVESNHFADATLRRIGTSAPTIERLIEMLSWKSASEKDVRRSAAVVVFMLTGGKLNALRVTGIPGAIESVASLLYADLDELNLLGLSILNKLAHEHDICDKIGKTRGLLDKIISYSSIANEQEAPAPAVTRLKAVKQSLRVVKRLATTTGTTGKLLRRELCDIVFTVSNIREVLQQHHENDLSELRLLAIEILTSLAMDDESREMIGGTGGVVSVLLAMFFPGKSDAAPDRQKDAVRVEAGEALAMLALDSRANCGAIIIACGCGVGRLIEALSDPVITISAARILRNLCTYAGEEWQVALRGVTAGAIKVLRNIMVEKTKLLNISLGLAAQMLRFMQPGELRAGLATAGVTDVALARTLVLVLREYSRPSMVVPRIRLYTLELAIALMRSPEGPRFVAHFVELEMERELRRVAETTSGLECFNVFSGSVGLNRRAVGVRSLVDSARELMRRG